MKSIRLLLLPAAVAAGCGDDPRHQAAGELVRLNDAIQAHLRGYGRMPSSLDAAQPESAANLAFRPARGVEVRLQGVVDGRYSATAWRSGWLCWSSAGAGDPVRPDCAPNQGGGAGGAVAPPLTPR